MKTIRLNEAMREKILERLINHAFKKRRDEIQADYCKLGDEVYDDILSADVRRKMKALPNDFFNSESGMQVSFGGTVSVVSFSKERPLPAKYSRYHAAKAYLADHDFSKRHHDLATRRRDFVEQEGKARTQAKAVLFGVATMKQLLEVWPECEPFVKDFLTAEKPSCVALSVPIDKFNVALGLP